MNAPSVVVVGPASCGKAQYAERLRLQYGVSRIVELDSPHLPGATAAQLARRYCWDCLLLTNNTALADEFRRAGVLVTTFAEAAPWAG